MFARNAASPARSGAGYVCHACRREQVLIKRQRRWNSELAANKSSAAGAGQSAEAQEDWLLPLNDLSDDYQEARTKQQVGARGSGSGSDNGKSPAKQYDGRQGGKATSLMDLLGSLEEVQQKEKPARTSEDGAGGRAVTATVPRAINRRERREERRERRRAQFQTKAQSPPSGQPLIDLSNLRDTLRARYGDQVQGEPEMGTAKEARGVAQTRSQSTSRSTTTTTTRSSKSTDSKAELRSLLERLGEQIEPQIDQMEAEHNLQDSEAQYEEYRAAQSNITVPEPEVKSKEPVPLPSFVSKDSADVPVSSSPGFFSSTLNFLKRKVGLAPSQPEPSSPATAKETGPGEKHTTPSKPSSPTTTKQVYSTNTSFEGLKSPRQSSQKSPIEMWEESSSRAPWGTTPQARSPPDTRVASFEDIASADRISVKKPISASVNKRPFGGERSTAIASPTSQLQTSTSQDDARKQAKADEPNTAHSRLSGLYSAQTAEQPSSDPSPDTNDTHDLAYLRRQHELDRVKQNVELSMRKSFGDLMPTGPELERAVEEEATRIMNGLGEKGDIRAASEEVSENPAGGVSLAAAMRAPPKRKVGRPRKVAGALPKSTEKKTAVRRVRSTRAETTPSVEVVAENEKSEVIAENDQSKVISENEETSETSADIEELKSLTPSQLKITPLDIPQPPVPYLQYGLDRVLFNRGVYQLQDEASRVYNFDPYLQTIMPNAEFDFDSLKEYKTSSKDEALANIAREHGNKYIGSTSSMTSALGHFHYLLSNWRPLNVGMLSHSFVDATKIGGKPLQLTQINRAPSAIFLRWKNGTYAIDADKEFDSANVLMLLGKSMELLLTLPKSEFERYRKSDPREVSEEQRTAPESYQYTTMRDFLMRSQLDAYDPRLPGNGTFDLKTRAVVTVRHAADDHEPMTGYEITGQHGKWSSYEKEYYDMTRSTMLKYMLQARMGRMNGIFVAYHNVERMFGFQYISIAEMDQVLHGQTDPSLGDQEFKASLEILNEVLNAATKKYPEQSLRIHFETKEEEGPGGMPTAMHVFAEPMSEEECDKIQNSQKAKIAEWERAVMGKGVPPVADDVEEDAQNAKLNADEVKSAGSSNEVEQDAAALEDETADLAEEDDHLVAVTEDDATAYARSLIDSENTEAAEDEVVEKSTAHGDTQYLEKLPDSDADGNKPLFYATIITQSRVNGFVPPGERPHNLKVGDDWQIDYILKEYDVGRHQWALYEDLKARRKHAFVKFQEEDGVEKKGEGYRAALRKLSELGREARKKKDLEEAGLPIVRVEELDMERLEEVESVEDYMRFLEKRKD